MVYRKVLGHNFQNNFNNSFKLFTIFHAKLYITQVIRHSQHTLLYLIAGEGALLNVLKEKSPNLLKTGERLFLSHSLVIIKCKRENYRKVTSPYYLVQKRTQKNTFV